MKGNIYIYYKSSSGVLLEPYSTDNIKREKRRIYKFEPVWTIPYVIPLIHKKEVEIDTGVDFKKRHPEFQRIMREEFEF
ncbi:MAG: hypothetical protein ACFE96_17715 [Candidatus Hermodarchaeota archaeon]